MSIETAPDTVVFATLTPFSRGTKQVDLESGIWLFRRRLQSKLFGPRSLKRGEEPMMFLAVTEENFNIGIHAHCIIGIDRSAVPGHRLNHLERLDELIVESWCSTEVGGVEIAQDVRPVSDVDGAFRYVMKGQRKQNLGGVDFVSMNIPQPLMEKMSFYA